MKSDHVLTRLGIRHPILLAPLGGGPSTPELAAAIANAGGLGALGCAYMTPDQIREAVRRTRELAPGRPVHANLFAGGWRTDFAGEYAEMAGVLNEVHRELGLGPVAIPRPADDPFDAQFDALIDVGVEVFSFTFGVPGERHMRRLKAANVFVMGTATTEDEARALDAAGCDAIIAQGAEAGGHRGTFAGDFENGMTPVRDLLEQIRRVTRLPLIAAGGLMTGADAADMMNRGAAAAMLGTAFLACPESGASAAYKQALLNAHEDRTVITRAFSGRPARGLENAFVRRIGDDIVAPYPLQNLMTRPMRTEAARQGRADYLSLWAGRGVAHVRSMPAGQLVRVLLDEMAAAT